MTVAEFIANLRRIVKRGAAMDAELPRAMTDALKFIEQNYNLSHMHRKRSFVIPANTLTMELADEPGYSLKSIKSFGYQTSAGNWYYLKQVDPGDFTSSDSTKPVGFIMTRGASGWAFEFDAAWTEATEIAMWGYYFQLWNGSTTQDDLWLLNNQTALVEARAMSYLSASMRDPQLMQMYSTLFAEQVTTLVQEDGERVQGSR
jgi:hypothetical protein